MIAIFCLRLAFGLIAALLVLAPSQVPPRFFRVQYLTALGLLAVSGFFLYDLATWPVWLLLGGAMTVAFTGSIIWHINNNPGQAVILFLAVATLLGMLIVGGNTIRGDRSNSWSVVDDLTSAGVLGAATSAMLMGHSYLIAPAMSLNPLYRLLGLTGAMLLLRVSLAGLGLYWWTGRPAAGTLEAEMLLWLGVRWIIGLVGPLVLGWMAWETARIRSTQSATGILYVVVILSFLGELTSQLLQEKTGYIL